MTNVNDGIKSSLINDNASDLQSSLNHLQQQIGFDQIAISPIGTPITIDFYEKWLSNNSYGNMDYLQKHLPFKKDPQKLLTLKTRTSHTTTTSNTKSSAASPSFAKPILKSVISVTHSYFPVVQPNSNLSSARISLYAQNIDYHYWLKDKLNQSIQILLEKYPQHYFLPFVDSGPVLERNWAYQNGLGWFGKNTCLIHPKKGSLFFIAEILTSIDVSTRETSIATLPDFCGKCTKCIDICPTSAIQPDRNLLADQCISYLTIESKKTPPLKLRSKIGDWFFGCDLCQTVCPWNQKVFKSYVTNTSAANTLKTEELDFEKHGALKNEKAEFQKDGAKSLADRHFFDVSLITSLTSSEKEELISFFRFLLTNSNKKIQKYFYKTALARAGAKGLIRNALVVIGNRKLIELSPEVRALTSNAYFSELAQWTLEQLT